MKLVDWAELQGISYRTAWRWFHAGRLPVAAYQTDTGMILVQQNEGEEAAELVGLYSRVSSHDQKKDLERQAARLRNFAKAAKLSNIIEVSEVGSGLNGKRRGLKKLLSNSGVRTIIVEHRDRLARFGVDYIEATLRSSGRELVVIEDSEFSDDLVRDFVDVVTSMCARIYGRRSAKARAKKALEAASK